MKKKYINYVVVMLLGAVLTVSTISACANGDDRNDAPDVISIEETGIVVEDNGSRNGESATVPFITEKIIYWDDSLPFANESVIHSSSVVLYYSQAVDKKNKTVCVNAGHGTEGGWEYYTYCHPDHSPKVTSGSTAEGAIKATAISGGTTLLDGTPEAQVNLDIAMILKEKLLASGYDVLMIRQDNNTQLDNIARTILANKYADCHVSLHYDSTEYDKGAFVITVPDIWAYKQMEPVASHWQEHNYLGDCIINGFIAENVNIYGGGSMGIDLTQISYSTIPSIDVELGDRASDHSYATQAKLAAGIVTGIKIFWGQ